jgi:hypothetical protein
MARSVEDPAEGALVRGCEGEDPFSTSILTNSTEGLTRL